MSSLSTGCRAVQWAIWKGGKLTSLTDQRFICCYAHNLTLCWSDSQSLNIIVLSQFPTSDPFFL